jgi:hypothetical protein
MLELTDTGTAADLRQSSMDVDNLWERYHPDLSWL